MEETMIKDLLIEAYHARPEISSSDVKAVAGKSLAHWKGKVWKDSSAFALGSAVHALVLEPEKNLVLRGPEDRRGNKWKEAQLAADIDCQILLTEGDYDLAQTIADPIINHEVVKAWVSAADFVAEASFFATDPQTGVKIKCRPDGFLLADGLAFDIKTTRDASPDGFPREIRNYNYDLQAAFYLRCLRAAGYKADTFIFVCVEKEPPHAVCLHVLTERYLAAADLRVTETLEKISKAEATNTFKTGWPLFNHIDLPRWQTEEPEADVFDDQIGF
jgi:exodeoxyribonuclease VIII